MLTTELFALLFSPAVNDVSTLELIYADICSVQKKLSFAELHVHGYRPVSAAALQRAMLCPSSEGPPLQLDIVMRCG